MNAIVSGQEGAAVLIQGTTCQLIRIDEEPVEILTAHIPHVFQFATDKVFLESTDYRTIIQTLNHEWQKDRALQTFLILLDSKNDDPELIELAVSNLEEMLGADVADHVSNYLYSSPIHEAALKSIQSRCHPQSRLKIYVDKLIVSQNDIRKYREEWDSLPKNLFDSELSRAQIQDDLIRYGFFKLAVRSAGKQNAFGLMIVEAHKKLARHKNIRLILSEWLKSPYSIKDIQHFSLLKESNESRRIDVERRPPARLSAHDAFLNARSQIEYIIPILRKGNIEKARDLITELINNQIKIKDESYACKTLCNFAQKSKEYGLHSFQLELLEKADAIYPNDARTYCQLADAYICLKRYDEASHYINLIKQTSESSYAICAHARILKDQGKLELALAEFKLITESHRDHVYAWIGLAETQREMWLLEDALSTYEAAYQNIGDPHLLGCKAAVLKDLGRLAEAERDYQELIHSNNVNAVVLCGYADVLKEMGQHERALEYYDQAINKYPDNPSGYCGKASIYKHQKKFNLALSLYDETINDFPYAAIPYAGKADVLKEMGRPQIAIEECRKIINNFSEDTYAWSIWADSLKKIGNYAESLRIYDQGLRHNPHDVFLWAGRADLLKRMGHVNEALAAYNKLIQRNPGNIHLQHSAASVLVLMRQYDQALAILPSRLPRSRDEWIGHHIRGMILLKQKLYPDAVKHFQEGLEKVEINSEKRYFRNALAVATICQEMTAPISPLLLASHEPFAKVLKLHTYCLSGSNQAVPLFEDLQKSCPRYLSPLRNELAGQFKLAKIEPRFDKQWILDEEYKLAITGAE